LTVVVSIAYTVKTRYSFCTTTQYAAVFLQISSRQQSFHLICMYNWLAECGLIIIQPRIVHVLGHVSIITVQEILQQLLRNCSDYSITICEINHIIHWHYNYLRNTFLIRFI
jgi:hypothetical protein